MKTSTGIAITAGILGLLFFSRRNNTAPGPEDGPLLAPGEYTPLPTTWDFDIETIPAYQDMKTALAAEASGTGGYNQMYFRSGWNLLANYYQGEVLPSLWQISLFVAGYTPKSLYEDQTDAITALSIVRNTPLSGSDVPPSLIGFNWSNPSANANYTEVRNFLTGFNYTSQELIDAAGLTPNDLDIMFDMSLTVQQYVTFLNAWENVPDGFANLNIPA